MAWQGGRTKTKRKARNKRVMGKDGTDIFILYQNSRDLEDEAYNKNRFYLF